MLDVSNLISNIKNNTTTKKTTTKREGSFSLIDYKPDDNKKSLAHIDKFLKVISMNDRISITYDNIPTAFLNVKTNTITLPNYITKDKDLYLLMGSHEVSHALHTPSEFYTAHNAGQVPVVNGIKLNPLLAACINIVEDIRIEKLIRNKFPGFVAVYQRGYKKLTETQETFKLTPERWDKMKLNDRINAKAKLGNLCYDLTTYENGVLKYMRTAENFDEVLLRAVYLYKLLIEDSNDLEANNEPEDKQKDESQEKDESNDSDESQDSQNSDNGDKSSDKSDDSKSDKKAGDSDKSDDKNDSKENKSKGSPPSDSSESDSNDSEESDSNDSEESDSNDSDNESEENSDSSGSGESSDSGGDDGEYSELKESLKNADVQIKDLQKKEASSQQNEEKQFSSKLLKQINDIANDIDKNNTANMDEYGEDLMEAALEKYLEDNPSSNNSIFTGRTNKYYSNIVKDPLSSLISLY